MKINYQHPALQYHDQITGEYNEALNEDGILHVLATYEVCHQCDGHGSHFCSDLDENKLIDIIREDSDEEGMDSYYQGAFDQMCKQCNGKRVVAKPYLPQWADDLVYDWHESEREYRAICRSEQRVGA